MFYEYGNEASKLLAQALQTKKANTTVHSLTDPSGYKLNSTPDIASHFVKYYSKLYNLPPYESTHDKTERKQMITKFLKQYSPHPILDSSFHELDKPLTKEEAEVALNLMKAGKKSGS